MKLKSSALLPWHFDVVHVKIDIGFCFDLVRICLTPLEAYHVVIFLLMFPVNFQSDL